MKKTTGFTLVELMITVAIVGILAAVAVPSYQTSVQKSRRADAEGALLNFANAMERLFTATNSYCDAAIGAAVANCGTATADTGLPNTAIYSPPANTATYYTVTISAASPTSYTLTATRAASQANDKCGDVTLRQDGTKGVINQTTGYSVTNCW